MSNIKYVLDTNVVLHDSKCLFHFDEHDVVLPITVLEELDNFKKGNESINFHARQFLRELDGLSAATDHIFSSGVPIGEGRGVVIIKMDQKFHEDLTFNLNPKKPDDQILNSAYCLDKDLPEAEVVLVSKDVNLRMKARSIGLKTEDYTTNVVKDVSTLYQGKRTLEDLPTELLELLYDDGSFPVSKLPEGEEPLAHENLILRNHRKSGLGFYDAEEGLIRRINKVPVFGITPRNAEQTFAINALLNPNVPLVTISGTAGTGKTLLALAAALHQQKSYRQIFLSRPIVPLSNKDIGYLPGEIKAKLDPYMQPLYDNLGVIQEHAVNSKLTTELINKMREEDKLQISALSYIRGRSLNNIYFIVDEAQNLTPHEVKTIITRAGEGTKVVLTGDVFQIDHPYLDSQSNGLTYLIEKMKGQHLYAHVHLEKGERSELADLASHLL